MKNIAVIFGGKSVEHDVSIITACQIMNNIDKEKFDVTAIYIDKNGNWWTGKDFDKKQTFVNFSQSKHKKISLKMGEPYIYFSFGRKKKIDCFFNCCHGTFGEDGNLQGVFNCLNVAFTGSDTLASALCMNKVMMKKLFEFYDFPIVSYEVYKRSDIVKCEKCKLKFPVIVKPANLGSSVGISKVMEKNQLMSALETAFCFDGEVIVEECVSHLREINCSVMKVGDEIVVSNFEEPIGWENFLTFDDKYVGGGKKSGQKRKLKVDLPKDIEKEIIDISKQSYEKLGLAGVVRNDFMLNDKTKQLYINEINTIPGSMAFYLWQGKQVSFRKLIELQIEDAFKNQENKLLNKTNFESKILEQ